MNVVLNRVLAILPSLALALRLNVLPTKCAPKVLFVALWLAISCALRLVRATVLAKRVPIRSRWRSALFVVHRAEFATKQSVAMVHRSTVLSTSCARSISFVARSVANAICQSCATVSTSTADSTFTPTSV